MQKPEKPVEGHSQALSLDFGFKVFVPQSRAELVKFVVESNTGNSILISGRPRALPALFLSENPDKQIIFMDLTSLNKVVEYSVADQVITVESGIRLSDFDRILGEQNQYFPIAIESDITLGEVINRGNGGLLEHRFGGPRELVLGLETACTNGLVHSGGRVVKNVTGYDLNKIFIGSDGTLGLPCLAHLRLFARPLVQNTYIFQAKKFIDLIDCVKILINMGLPLSALELVSTDLLNGLDIHSEAALLVSVSGYENEVAEILSQLTSLTKEKQLARLDVSNTWVGALSAVSYASVPLPVEANIAPSKILTFFEHLRSKNFSFLYRPGNGRTQFLIKPPQIEEFVDAIKSFASTYRTPVVVACSNRRFDRVVINVPAEDAAMSRLKKELRSRFDANCHLNPCFQV